MATMFGSKDLPLSIFGYSMQNCALVAAQVKIRNYCTIMANFGSLSVTAKPRE